MPPEGRMVVSVVLALFFGGFAWGSLHSARQDYRWRNAEVVRGVLVKNGSRYHYEYRPPGKAPVVGASFTDDLPYEADGVVDDWVRLEYDPALSDPLRRHLSKGRASSNYKQFVIEASAGSVFAAAVAGCLLAFLRAWHDKRRAAHGIS
jgi:hypothetical protein